MSRPPDGVGPDTGPLLVLLAAGLGRRFGGLKQLVPVGPDGEALMDLTVGQAAEAGFAGVVAIVRTEIREEVVDHLRERSPLPVTAACQDLRGPAREVPWGTAHAVTAAAEHLDRPFAVANADDLYGAEALALVAGWLRGPACRPGAAALVTYRLDATVPAEGSVSRAPCTVVGGQVTAIAERTGVRRTSEGDGFTSDQGPLAADTPVSMNLWGFHPSIVAALAADFAAFVADHAAPTGAPPDAGAAVPEHLLPDVVGRFVAAGRLAVEALPTTARWLGLTHPDDLPLVRSALAGHHPS